ncbi:MAG: alpha/beta fold hydrolase [Lentimicrobiaceae bacterium]|nr:alpha/beta fold hydrolase [Lentimicrobiaceae bacterium]
MDLFFRKYGSGQNIIILHGLFGQSDNWIPVARLLEKNFTVWLPDLRNHGQSPHSDEFNYSVIAHDVCQFVSKHNITDFVIVGHSMGGKAALKISADNICPVKAQIIIDIAPKQYQVSEYHLNILKCMQNLDLDELKYISNVEKELKRLQFDDFTINLIIKNLKYVDKKLVFKLDVESIYNNISNITAPIIANKPIETKTLFIKADESDYIKAEDFALIKESYVNAELRIIASSDHYVHVRKPVELSSLISEWFMVEMNN